MHTSTTTTHQLSYAHHMTSSRVHQNAVRVQPTPPRHRTNLREPRGRHFALVWHPLPIRRANAYSRHHRTDDGQDSGQRVATTNQRRRIHQALHETRSPTSGRRGEFAERFVSPIVGVTPSRSLYIISGSHPSLVYVCVCVVLGNSDLGCFFVLVPLS